MAAAPLRVLPVLVAAALTLSACGQTSKDSAKDFQGQQKAVAQTVENLQSAASKGDRDKICDQILAADLVAQIKKANPTATCADALKDPLKDADSFELQVKKVTIDGTTATALVESDAAGKKKQTDTLTLTKVGKAWRISSLGQA
ncbi:MAG TPA: nuclear transport factor 2 family protein [Baekduia sp.]|uniref:nuclear transport factor 2 family protein n=1 Tax=Baekduia sp. TaxID=2600305 RepID=UPI002D776BFE|nr:nuclear transport factor 2 family protein [Baekduia sp.]HET6505480.1 nuclear transport factor 2 family protein [Baekduia sp.]